ncbi:hypothetical protein ACO2Q8_28785 [Larkinella sp. VNQ87]|uniref:hypothetical protein n=1 Tax=Larkinella sp. VNQ87 TaxID=3400921 RepID=UPI003C12A9A2
MKKQLRPELNWNQWIINTRPDDPIEGDDFLDYKISIQVSAGAKEDKSFTRKVSQNNKQLYETEKYPLLISNMGGKENKEDLKNLVFHQCNKDGFSHLLIITCFDDELRNFIGENIASFLSQNNFGNRQTKGFGSFYLTKPPSDSIEYRFWRTFPEKEQYYFRIDVSQLSYSESCYQTFEYIDCLYRALKSGINHCGKDGKSVFYFKSLLYQFAINKGWTWDKKAIKSAFFNNEPFGNSSYLVRDILGLSTQSDWKSQRFSLSKTNSLPENNRLMRITSPIQFKPIRKGAFFFIYIQSKPISNEIWNQAFEIKTNKREYESLTLFTPPITQKFTIREYLRFALMDFWEMNNVESYAEYPDKNHRDVIKYKTILSHIIEEIRKNY